MKPPLDSSKPWVRAGGYDWAKCPACGEYHVWDPEWPLERLAARCVNPSANPVPALPPPAADVEAPAEQLSLFGR